MIIIIDTCYSGKMITAIKKLNKSKTKHITVLTACKGSEVGKYNSQGGFNRFTAGLYTAWANHGDQEMTAADFYVYALEHCNQYNPEMHPQFWYGKSLNTVIYAP